MRKHVIAVFVILLAVCAAVVVGLQHTSGTLADKMYLAVNMACAAFLFVLGIIGAFVTLFVKSKIARNYSLLIVLMAVPTAIVPTAVHFRRINRTEAALTAVYTQLVRGGTPFPPAETVLASIQNRESLIECGCWVAEDRQSFELFYHVGSDSSTLKYPTGRWEWRGFNYRGPE